MSEPVVWIVDAEHWARACLRAELIERGYDALGFETMLDALARLVQPGWPRPHVLVVDLTSQAVDSRQLQRFTRAGAALIGVAGAVKRPSPELQEVPWLALLRRPITLGAIADTVDHYVGGSAPGASWAPTRPA